MPTAHATTPSIDDYVARTVARLAETPLTADEKATLRAILRARPHRREAA